MDTYEQDLQEDVTYSAVTYPRLVTQDGTPIQYQLTNDVRAHVLAPLGALMTDHDGQLYPDAGTVDRSYLKESVDRFILGEPVFMCARMKHHLGGDLLVEHEDGAFTPYQFETPPFAIDDQDAAFVIAKWLNDLQYYGEIPEPKRVQTRLLKLADKHKVKHLVLKICKAMDVPL